MTTLFIIRVYYNVSLRSDKNWRTKTKNICKTKKIEILKKETADMVDTTGSKELPINLSWIHTVVSEKSELTTMPQQ